jgi:hypothetical protein
MGNFAESHSLPTFAERKKALMKEGGKGGRNPITNQRWLRADEIVDQIYCDMVNGSTSSDIELKLANKQYDGQRKPIGYRTAMDYIMAAKSRLKYDFEADMKDLRADVYAKLLAVYSDAIADDDRYNALGALDKILKLGGIDKPQTAIQINGGGSDGKVVVNFGFSNNDDDE